MQQIKFFKESIFNKKGNVAIVFCVPFRFINLLNGVMTR
jgi:hypothetical protein